MRWLVYSLLCDSIQLQKLLSRTSQYLLSFERSPVLCSKYSFLISNQSLLRLEKSNFLGIFMQSPNFFLLHLQTQLYFGEQWWHRGESTRLPPMWPGLDSQTRHHMWVEFVGSLLSSERFSPGYSGFPLSSKTCIWFNLICINFNLQCPQLVCLNAK